MKKIHKVISMSLLFVILSSNIVGQVEAKVYNLKPSNIEIRNTIVPWLLSEKEKNITKDLQLCKVATSFDILDDNGKIISTYYPQGCQEDFNKTVFFNDNNGTGALSDNSVNSFLNNLFSDSLIKDKNDEKHQTKEVNKEDFSADEEDLDSFLKDLFGYKLNNRLKKQAKYDNFGLKGKQISSSLREYSNSKMNIKVGNIKATVLKDKEIYNIKIAELLANVDKEFKINSIKNDFAKNINKISYSYSTYINNDIDTETKEVFRKQLINDLKTLQKKYKILKFKDTMISKTLEKRQKM